MAEIEFSFALDGPVIFLIGDPIRIAAERLVRAQLFVFPVSKGAGYLRRLQG